MCHRNLSGSYLRKQAIVSLVSPYHINSIGKVIETHKVQFTEMTISLNVYWLLELESIIVSKEIPTLAIKLAIMKTIKYMQ